MLQSDASREQALHERFPAAFGLPRTVLQVFPPNIAPSHVSPASMAPFPHSVGAEQHVSYTRFATGLDLGGGAFSLTNSVHEVRVAGDVNLATELLRDGKIDLYASGIESVMKIANLVPGTKIIGAFETVAFAISTAKGWSPAAHSRLTQLVNEAKAAGIVEKAIEKSGSKGVRAAPN